MVGEVVSTTGLTTIETELVPLLPVLSVPVMVSCFVTGCVPSTNGAAALPLQVLPFFVSVVLTPSIVAKAEATPESASVIVAETAIVFPSVNCAFATGAVIVIDGGTLSFVIASAEMALAAPQVARMLAVVSTATAAALMVNVAEV